MTDEEKLKAAQELDAAYARAETFDRARADEGEHLDAYGHMNWTVGNKDWLACFDAIRVPEGIAYHVVVDCDSGGFNDETEYGVEPIETAVEKLTGLPWRYADSCIEQYSNVYWALRAREDGDSYEVSTEEVEKTAASWRAHLLALAAEPAPEPDEEPSDEYGELRRAALNHRGEP